MKTATPSRKNLLLLAALLALTVSTVSLAESHSFYGDFRYSLNDVDHISRDQTSDNNSSHLGAKGSFNLSADFSLFYHLETGVNIDEEADTLTQRFYFAGIQGSMGKLIYGRTSTQYKVPGFKIDPFYNTSAGLGFGGATYGLSGLTNGWTDKSLTYSSPSYGHFSFNAALYIDDSHAGKHDTNVGFTYAKDNLVAGLQALRVNDSAIVAKSTADSLATRAHLKYTVGLWVLGASYENIDINSASDQQYLYLSSIYQYSKKLKFAGSFGKVDKVSNSLNGTGIYIGAFYQLFQKTNISLLYSRVDLDNASDRDTFSLGLSQKFNF